MRAGNFDPMICSGCGHVETEFEREFDKDCKCGGYFVEQPYVFKEKPAVRSSTNASVYDKGKQ